MRYLTPKELKNEKNEVGKPLSQLSGKNVKHDFAIRVFEHWAPKISSNKTINILDLGTASGHFLKQLHERGYKNLHGHDVDDYLPEETKKLLKEYRLAELSNENLPWPDNFFDIVTAWCVLPHLENPFRASREVARVLKQNGLFIFTALHLTSKPSIDYFVRHKNFGSYREGNNHIALLPPSVVKKTMSKNFKIIGTDYLIIPKIFRGWRGKIRKYIYQLATKYPRLEMALKERWGYNIAYVLQKKDLNTVND